MKVILKRESEYDFNEGKFTAIPSSVFSMLVDSSVATSNIEYPKVIMFNDANDYRDNSWKYNINPLKDVYVSQKGQIFCFIMDEVTESENGATDTEENK